MSEQSVITKQILDDNPTGMGAILSSDGRTPCIPCAHLAAVECRGGNRHAVSRCGGAGDVSDVIRSACGVSGDRSTKSSWAVSIVLPSLYTCIHLRTLLCLLPTSDFPVQRPPRILTMNFRLDAEEEHTDRRPGPISHRHGHCLSTESASPCQTLFRVFTAQVLCP